MIEIICGEKGKGKTKQMLSRVNEDIRKASGNIVYLDKSQKHIYEMDSKIRLINMSEYPIINTDEFFGFMCGMLSQNNDIEEIFLDSFLKVAFIDTSEGLRTCIDKLAQICDTFGVRLILSVSLNEKDLPDNAKEYLWISL